MKRQTLSSPSLFAINVKSVLSLVVLFLLFFSIGSVAHSQSPEEMEGAKYFKQFCATCHTIGGGRLVGPDLAGVTERRSEEWLIKFIKSSQSMISAGDPEAVAIYEEYGKMVMPDAPFTEAQIKEIINYMRAVEGKGSKEKKIEKAPKKEQGTPSAGVGEYTQEDVLIGKKLFLGKRMFENGGPSCVSCHDVDGESNIWGGTLAKDLTDSFSRLGEGGIGAILRNPPFPVMAAAYNNKPLTDEEVRHLIIFLKEVDKQNRVLLSKESKKFVTSGVVGLFFLVVAYSFIWHDRKKYSVYQRIFSRQVKSE